VRVCMCVHGSVCIEFGCGHSVNHVYGPAAAIECACNNLSEACVSYRVMYVCGHRPESLGVCLCELIQVQL
jgi:hypothetical protein